ncbi:hypothetical protein [Streptomyces sp. NPDC059258]|uniref:hypothetical protein n=1 Tax=unclassified Streptomyces TaxID=2593676 RepID=UPI00368BEDA7
MTARALLTPDLPPRYATPDLPGACVPVVPTVPMPTASFAGRGRAARPGGRRGGGTGGEHREEGGGDSVTP